VDRDRGASRRRLVETLLSNNPDHPDPDWSGRSPISVINSLFPLLYSGDARIKTRAVAMMGRLVADLARSHMEKARNVLRRLMWNLNDESGGIGWGSPEAMGEILARHAGLAGEYGAILASYARKDGNFLESEILQRGVLWALLRLWEAQKSAFPDLSLQSLTPFLESPDAAVRGLAAELIGKAGDRGGCGSLAEILSDEAEYERPIGEPAVRRRVREAAAGAMERLGCGGDPGLSSLRTLDQ
jgi:hypothetical protein